MLTDEAFRAWVQRNKIDPTAEATLARIRSSPPSRRVRGRASNVSGRYPSVKMGCSIQFESLVEFLAIYAMERDDDVLEYYDQPTRIQLHYRSKSGHKTSPWHTPDFLVIRRNGAGFEEWKPENALEGLTTRMPERYQPDPRARLEMEARIGENRVARAKAQSEQELQRLLGTPVKETRSDRPNAVSPSSQGGTKHSGERIERAATRDPVGEHIPTGNANKCSFSGTIEIDAQRFRDSGIERVECPECHALRQITPRSSILRYPSHEKRKTHVAHIEPRWVQGENGWEGAPGTRK